MHEMVELGLSVYYHFERCTQSIIHNRSRIIIQHRYLGDKILRKKNSFNDKIKKFYNKTFVSTEIARAAFVSVYAHAFFKK